MWQRRTIFFMTVFFISGIMTVHAFADTLQNENNCDDNYYGFSSYVPINVTVSSISGGHLVKFCVEADVLWYDIFLDLEKGGQVTFEIAKNDFDPIQFDHPECLDGIYVYGKGVAKITQLEQSEHSRTLKLEYTEPISQFTYYGGGFGGNLSGNFVWSLPSHCINEKLQNEQYRETLKIIGEKPKPEITTTCRSNEVQVYLDHSITNGRVIKMCTVGSYLYITVDMDADGYLVVDAPRSTMVAPWEEDKYFLCSLEECIESYPLDTPYFGVSTGGDHAVRTGVYGYADDDPGAIPKYYIENGMSHKWFKVEVLSEDDDSRVIKVPVKKEEHGVSFGGYSTDDVITGWVFNKESISEYTKPSFNILPEHQVKQNTSDITCKENHVLVERTNGKMACLTEGTAEKVAERFGWMIVPSQPTVSKSIIDNVCANQQSCSQLKADSKTSVNRHNMEFVHNLETIQSQSGYSAPDPYLFPGTVTAEISQIPKLGDIVEITVTAQLDPPSNVTQILEGLATSHFEYIEDSFPTGTTFSSKTFGSDKYNFATVKIQGMPAMFTFQVRAISEGYAAISTTIDYVNSPKLFRIYIDKENSFYYDNKDLPTEHVIPGPRLGLPFAEHQRIQEKYLGVSGASDEDIFAIIPKIQKEVDELTLSRINLLDHIDDNRYYYYMPHAQNVNATAAIPQAIPLGSTEMVQLNLSSIDRQNDAEQVRVLAVTGPGIKLDNENHTVYHDDVFAIGPNNTSSIEYPIKAVKTGTWMLNFIINEEYHRHLIVVE